MRAWAGYRAAFHRFHPEGRRRAPPRSLQHDIFEVLLQDGVLDGVEDKADIFRVYRGGEVVEERLAPVSPLAAERLHQERLKETGREGPEDLNLGYGARFVRESVFQQPGWREIDLYGPRVRLTSVSIWFSHMTSGRDAAGRSAGIKNASTF